MWSSDVSSARKRKRADYSVSKQSRPEKVEEPQTIEDLVTHSRKIADVREVLVKAEKRAQIILFTGPTGSCKTTTLEVVARNLGLDIQEWINPVDKVEFGEGNEVQFDSNSYSEPSQKEKFEAFIFRCSRYKPLFSNSDRRIILIEDIPNYFIRDPAKFREFLHKYRQIGQCPIVFICTEDENLNLDHTLFPQDVRNEFLIVNIKFNPIPQTCLMKVLKRHSSLNKEKLEAIIHTSNGDIRSALASLQFSQSVRAAGKSSSVVKDVSTDFYKNLGRILYPKRSNDSTSNGKEFQYDLNEISENLSNNFQSMLHENYLNTFSNMEDTIKGSAVFSDGDILSSGGNELKSYLAFISVSGLMCANKKPKKGTFRPMVRSRFADLSRNNTQVKRLYPQFLSTNRVLNLDLIPYLPAFPSFATVVSSSDCDRFANCAIKRAGPSPHIFKVPLTPKSTTDFDEEMNIEEFDN